MFLGEKVRSSLSMGRPDPGCCVGGGWTPQLTPLGAGWPGCWPPGAMAEGLAGAELGLPWLCWAGSPGFSRWPA